ncbi:peptidoglycan editing factor PgeF [Aeromicrobium massiliense]|uniref:peptidoglycan editing factor PgeF n=1 Tax=Aeromicrobium massiliense TaxID=1464554 RepID=UPI000A9B503D|nr:peptidoglycan editing factor PgeF [Aeromicrobium massiliense]
MGHDAVLHDRAETGPVVVALTARAGGVSEGPYAALNLGDHVGDDPVAVAENLRRLADALEVERVVGMTQVHGSDVAVVGSDSDEPTADAMVTVEPGVALLVRVADCLPVVLADPEAGVVGVAHAGRKGLELGVVPRTVGVMREHGAAGLRAWTGPHACGRCYEVPADMAAEVERVAPGSASRTSWGTAAIDLAAGVAAQLTAADVLVEQLPGCTIEDDTFFSHRRQGGTAGRFGMVVVNRGPA